MRPQRFALIGGAIMLILGTLSFVPSLSTYPAELPSLTLDTSYGLFLGLFAMNIVNKVAMVTLGIWGILASQAKNTSLPASINYARWLCGITGVLAIIGVVPQANTLNGYWPLFGAEVGLHAVLAVLGAYFGFTLTSKAAAANERLKKDHIRAA